MHTSARASKLLHSRVETLGGSMVRNLGMWLVETLLLAGSCEMRTLHLLRELV